MQGSNSFSSSYICTTDANRPEKKDEVLKTYYTYVYCLAKLSMKYLFISCR